MDEYSFISHQPHIDQPYLEIQRIANIPNMVIQAGRESRSGNTYSYLEGHAENKGQHTSSLNISRVFFPPQKPLKGFDKDYTLQTLKLICMI